MQSYHAGPDSNLSSLFLAISEPLKWFDSRLISSGFLPHIGLSGPPRRSPLAAQITNCPPDYLAINTDDDLLGAFPRLDQLHRRLLLRDMFWPETSALLLNSLDIRNTVEEALAPERKQQRQEEGHSKTSYQKEQWLIWVLVNSDRGPKDIQRDLLDRGFKPLYAGLFAASSG